MFWLVPRPPGHPAPQNGSPRMFRVDWIEKHLSRVKPWQVLIVWVPAIAYLIYRGLQVPGVSQGAFAAFILGSGALHYLATTQQVASIDAYCPFGGVETLWRWFTTGSYVSKTHASNLVLLVGLLAGTLLAGGAFCGWVCPFGALQELLANVRRWLRLPQLKVPEKLDRWLGYGRYVVLAGILYATISTVKLWFASYDPYRTIFGLGWLFEPNLAEAWPAYLVAGVILVGAVLIPRFWCRYACPLGGLISLVQRISFLRIGR